MNCLYPFRTKNKLKLHEKVCQKKKMKILWFLLMTQTEFNQCQKTDKTQFIIYADLKCLTKINDECKNNPWTSSTTKVGEHIPSGVWMSTILSFKNTENKHDVYKREHTMKIIKFKKKKNEVGNKGTAEIIWKCKSLFL